MKKEDWLNLITFLIGGLFLMNSILYENSLFFGISIFLIYFSEVIQDNYKELKHKLEMAEMRRETENLKNMKSEDKEKNLKKYTPVLDSWTENRKKERAWAKAHPVLSTIKEIYWTLRSYFWYRVPGYPHDIKLWVKTKYQRAKRGWAVSDAWGFDYYLARVIKEGCQWLKKNKHGIPMSAFAKDAPTDENGNHTDEAFDEACKNWDIVLDKIIKTFEIAEHILEDHWLYFKSSEYDQKEADKYIKSNEEMRKEDPELWEKRDLHVMTLVESKEYEEGWELFREHFFGLWD